MPNKDLRVKKAQDQSSLTHYLDRFLNEQK